MRLLTILLARGHLRAAVWHGERAGQLLDGRKASRAARSIHPVERLLLASIVGLGICGVWIGMTWGAMP